MRLLHIYLSSAFWASAALAQDWPPSSDLPSPYTDTTPVSYCTGTDSEWLPARWFEGVTTDLNDKDSPVSKMIQAACQESGNDYGSCEDKGKSRTCKYHVDTFEYSAKFEFTAYSGKFSACSEAPFYVVKQCGVAQGGDTKSSIGGTVASNTFGGSISDSENYESYKFQVTPAKPFARCDWQTSDEWRQQGLADIENAWWARENICNECNEYGASEGCYRRISQINWNTQAYRRNLGSQADFSNCWEATEAILKRCWEKGNGGGWWALDNNEGAESQEFYSITVEQLEEFQMDL